METDWSPVEFHSSLDIQNSAFPLPRRAIVAKLDLGVSVYASHTGSEGIFDY